MKELKQKRWKKKKTKQKQSRKQGGGGGGVDEDEKFRRTTVSPIFYFVSQKSAVRIHNDSLTGGISHHK